MSDSDKKLRQLQEKWDDVDFVDLHTADLPEGRQWRLKAKPIPAITFGGLSSIAAVDAFGQSSPLALTAIVLLTTIGLTFAYFKDA